MNEDKRYLVLMNAKNVNKARKITVHPCLSLVNPNFKTLSKNKLFEVDR
jgi:hypothetical protein